MENPNNMLPKRGFLIWHADCLLEGQTAKTRSSGQDLRDKLNANLSETAIVPLNRDIYPNLKLRMYTSGIRQNRLARMLGIHEASLSRIMNGFREPTGEVRAHLAAILQSDPEWLFLKVQISEELSLDQFDGQPGGRLTPQLQ